MRISLFNIVILRACGWPLLPDLIPPDGLTVYVLLCPGLYDRDGTPYSDTQNRDWDDKRARGRALTPRRARQLFQSRQIPVSRIEFCFAATDAQTRRESLHRRQRRRVLAVSVKR